MQQVLKGEEGLACIKCGRRASFLCPLGALCPTDALMAAAIHGWIPAQISPRTLGPGWGDDFSTSDEDF